MWSFSYPPVNSTTHICQTSSPPYLTFSSFSVLVSQPFLSSIQVLTSSTASRLENWFRSSGPTRKWNGLLTNSEPVDPSCQLKTLSTVVFDGVLWGLCHELGYIRSKWLIPNVSKLGFTPDLELVVIDRNQPSSHHSEKSVDLHTLWKPVSRQSKANWPS